MLQQAIDAFGAADAALKKDPPDYTTYGQQLALAQQLVGQAQQLLTGGAPTTTTTTIPGGGSA